MPIKASGIGQLAATRQLVCGLAFSLVLAGLTTSLGIGGRADAEDIKVVCPPKLPKTPSLSLRDVYKEVPFKPGERADYEVTWGGMLVGIGTLEVRKPIRYNNVWQRVFHIDAKTGDWFKHILVAHEQMNAISRPWDFGISNFYMEQHEGKLFSSPYERMKWLEFDHDHCKVTERTQQPGKPEKIESHDLAYGAIDALGVLYQYRTRTFHLHKKERAMVYTSEKNWWLEADPQAFEKITVPAGTFDTVKLKLQTYLGEELQQKGDVYAWFATNTKEHEMVQLQGEIKLGSVWIKLKSFLPGS